MPETLRYFGVACATNIVFPESRVVMLQAKRDFVFTATVCQQGIIDKIAF